MTTNPIARALVLAAFLWTHIAAPAYAQSSIEDALDTPRVMFYATKRFGANNDVRTVPSFGLRYEQPVSIGSMDWQMDASDIRFVPMLDYKFSHGVGTRLSLYNMSMYGTGAYYDSSVVGSYTQESLRQYGWLLDQLSVVRRCFALLEEVICEESDDESAVPLTGTVNRHLNS